MTLGKKFLIDILYNIKFHELVCSVLHELIFVIDTLMKSGGEGRRGATPGGGGGVVKGLGCKFEGLILFTWTEGSPAF